MVADINSYSPYIQAVFGNAPGDRYIPFSISDRSADQENPALLAFSPPMLALPESRCQASELLELLEVPAVMSRFGFDSDKFERVKLWIEEVGIRWGLDDDTAEEFALAAPAAEYLVVWPAAYAARLCHATTSWLVPRCIGL